MQVGGVIAETEVYCPVEPLVESVHCYLTYLPRQHVDDNVDIPELAELLAMLESVTVVDRYADAPDYASMGLHVVHMHVVTPICEPACDVGAD